MIKCTVFLLAWGSLFSAASSFALPPSTPQYLLNQQVQSNNYNRFNTDSGAAGRGGIPVIDAGAILKMKQDAWKVWNTAHDKNLSFSEWDDSFNKGTLNERSK